MGYLIIEDFKGGLDTRKFRLAAPAGTLTDLVNAHITPGAEIEKRKAFVKLSNSDGGVSTSLPAGTFGLQPVPGGFVVFGSQASAGLTFPSSPTFTYQRLQHPAVLANAAYYDASKHDMDSIVHSELFGGKAFAIAKFKDTYSFAYYDGTLVADFVAGLVLPYLAGNNVRLAAHLTALANAATGYTAVQRANPNDNQTDVTGAYGADYVPAESKSSTSGTITDSKQADAVGPASAVAAVGSFRIIGGSANAGTNKISKVEVNGVTVTNAAVDWTTSNAATAALIAASINTKVSSPDYTATSDGDRVIITAVTAGTGSNAYEVKVTCAGNVCAGSCALTFVFGTMGFTFNGLQVDGVDIGGSVTGKTCRAGGDYTSVAGFVTALAGVINGGATYCAYDYGATLFLSKKVTSSLDAPIDVYATVTNYSTGTGAGVNGGSAPASTSALTSTVPSSSSTNVTTSPGISSPVSCTAAGGTAPYSYHWQEETTGAAGDLIIATPNAQTTTFSANMNNRNKTGRFVCVVTDASGVKATSGACQVTLTKV